MKRLTRFLRAFRVFWKFFELPQEAVDWTQADAEALRDFLETRAGQKLQSQMKAAEAQQNAAAVLRTDHSEYCCGWASGFRASSSWVISLSAIAPPQEDELMETSGSLLGEAELTETLSP